MSKINVMHMLRANNKKEEKKSKIPAIGGHGKMVDELSLLYQRCADAETAFRVRESSFLQIAGKEYEKRAMEDEFTKSLNFSGEKTIGIQVSWSDRFHEIPVEHESILKAALGPSFQKVFREKREIVLKKTDDAVVKKLVAKLGQKLFEEIFEIKISLVPTPDMDKKQFSLPEDVQAFVKQYKASLKIRKE